MMIKDGEVVDFTKSEVAYTDPRALASSAKVEEAPLQTPLETTTVRVSSGAAGCYDEPEAQYSPNQTAIRQYEDDAALKELISLAEKEAMPQETFEKVVLDNAAPAITRELLSPLSNHPSYTKAAAELSERAKITEEIFNMAIAERNKLLAKKVNNRLEMLNEQAEIELTSGLKGQIKALEWVLQEISK